MSAFTPSRRSRARPHPHRPRREPLRRGRRRHRQDDRARRAGSSSCCATGARGVDEIAVITFTEAAAAELAARVREELEHALAGQPTSRTSASAARGARRPLPRARRDDPRLRDNLLRERPVEAGLDPRSRCSTSSAPSSASTTAYDDWLTELLAEARAGGRHARSRAASTCADPRSSSTRSTRTARCCRSTAEAQPADVGGFVALVPQARHRRAARPARRARPATRRRLADIETCDRLRRRASRPRGRRASGSSGRARSARRRLKPGAGARRTGTTRTTAGD